MEQQQIKNFPCSFKERNPVTHTIKITFSFVAIESGYNKNLSRESFASFFERKRERGK